MNGHAAAAAPTAAKAPVATYMKSRRVGSAVVVVAKGLPSSSVLAPRWREIHERTLPGDSRSARRFAGDKIESRFSRVLRHDDAENAGISRGWRISAQHATTLR